MRHWALLLLIFAFSAGGIGVLIEGAGAQWSVVLSGVSFAIALLFAYYLLLGLSMAAVLLRALFSLVPIGLLAGGVIFLVLQSDAFAERETQALIAAIVVAAGWVVTYLTGEWRRVGAEQERRRDLIEATITELELISVFGRTADWDQVIADTRKAFRMNARYDVFVFYGNQFDTLKRLVSQIEVLEWRQISPVLQVYQALDRLERMEERMHTEGFKNLPKQRREDGAIRYLKVSADIPNSAENAVKALKDGPFQGLLKRLR